MNIKKRENILKLNFPLLEFNKGSNTEARDFLSKEGKMIVRMRGLPFNATGKEVVSTFKFFDIYSLNLSDTIFR